MPAQAQGQPRPGDGTVLASPLVATTPGSPHASADRTPHLIYLAIGFPPAAKSSAYRLRETANQFRKQGWDVTVVTIQSEAWEREFGLDHSLSEQVEPGIEIVELPLIREDFETDIRKFSEGRALRPAAWITELRKREVREFPEAVFGAWRRALEDAVVAIHRRHPADLALATCAPYVNFAAVWKLWETHRVPYAIDFRDGWSLDVVNGGESFRPDSPAGEWERKVLDEALSVWVRQRPDSRLLRRPAPAHRLPPARRAQRIRRRQRAAARTQARPGRRPDVRLPRHAQLLGPGAGEGPRRLARGPAARPAAGPLPVRRARSPGRRRRTRGQRGRRAAALRRGRRRDVRRAGPQGRRRRPRTPAGTRWC